MVGAGDNTGGWVRVNFSFFLGVLLYRRFRTKPPRVVPLWVGCCLPLIMVGTFGIQEGGEHRLLLFTLVVSPLLVWLGARVELAGIPRAIAIRLGKLSYSLYVTHMATYHVMKLVASILSVEVGSHARTYAIVWSLIAIMVAWLLDFSYDGPVRKLLTKRLAIR